MMCIFCLLVFIVNLVLASSTGRHAVENRDVILKCSSNGSVLWHRKTIGESDFNEIYMHEVLLKPFLDRFSIPSLYNLMIANVSMEDAGLYQCVGNNGFGGIVEEYNLTILGSSITCNRSTDRAIGLNSCNIPPSFVNHSCWVIYAGGLQPSITWTDLSSGSLMSSAYPHLSVLPNGRKRLSSEFTFEAEMVVSLYKCSVENLLFCNATPVVVEYVIESNVHMVNNSSGTLYCIANSSLNTCDYTWSIGEEVVSYKQNQTGDLLLSPEAGRSGGNFTCTATCILDGEKRCKVKVMSVEITQKPPTADEVSQDFEIFKKIFFPPAVILIILSLTIIIVCHKTILKIFLKCKKCFFKKPVEMRESIPLIEKSKCFEGGNFRPYDEPSLPLHIFKCASQYGDRPAFIDPDNQNILYKDLEGRIKRMARVLWFKYQVRSEDKVALVLPNCIEYPIIFHALLHLGAICVPILYSSTQDKLEIFLKDCEASFVVTDEASLGKCNFVHQSCSFKILLIKGGLNCPLLEDEVNEALVLPEMDYLPETKAAIVYSSGTTGIPKGCVHTHMTYLANLSQICDHSVALLKKGSEVTVTTASMSHMFGQNFYLTACIASGCTTIILNKFSETMCLCFLASYKATCAHLYPNQLFQILHSSQLSNYDLTSLLKVEMQATIFDKSVIQLFKEKLPWCCLLKGYGLTETMCLAKERMTDERKPGSVGRLLPGVQAKVLDYEKENDLETGYVGELMFHSPALFLEYLGGRKQVDEFGFFKTGDVGFFDRSGRLHVTGRKDDLIKCNEDYVNPADIEEIIKDHPKVRDVAVVGVQVESRGEAPKAFVVKAEESLNEDEIHFLVNGAMVLDKRLHGGVEFVSFIPRSETGKICRAKLKKKNLLSYGNGIAL